MFYVEFVKMIIILWSKSEFHVSCFYFRDYFYQFGEIRSINVVTKQQCAFIQFTLRSAAETAAEKSFNKLIINGRRLNIKWGKSQGQQGQEKEEEKEEEKNLEPVPGLPGGNKLFSVNQRWFWPLVFQQIIAWVINK